MERTHWYKNAVVYQIYPFSYLDSNNDGMGDIPGIISKLDYIRELGATAIWFSPLYESPLKDYGYDISDYRKINPAFGTMEDFDRLLAECHKRGLKVIMDIVLNHTSDQHVWFREALKSKDSPYRDYYIIRKGRKKGKKLVPPTNWTSSFTGSAWERIDGTDEYYLHLFCKEQPDLNWENPKVRAEIFDILRFYLEKGVDGFRFDVFNMFSKSYPFKDDKSGALFQKGTMYFVDGPRMHEFLKEMNKEVLSQFDSYTVGESYQPNEADAYLYVAEKSKELDSIFNFSHLTADNIGGINFFHRPFDLPTFKKGLFDAQQKYFNGGWNTLVLENHDLPRSNCRFGIDTKKYRYEASTFLAAVTFMGFGIPFIYQGEEIGMTNADFHSVCEMKDPVSHFVFNLLRKYNVPRNLAFRLVNNGARDHARVPMQWDNSVNAGFNTGTEPWQRMSNSADEINVAKDLAAEKSIYAFYQKVLKIKKENPIAVRGETFEYDHENRKIIAYSRNLDGQRLLIIGNFSNDKAHYTLPSEFAPAYLDLLLSNYEDSRIERELHLRPYEALILQARNP